MRSFDLLLLAFKAIAIASVPLAAVWIGGARRHGGDRLRRLAVVTAFLTFDLVVFGGFTRLTDSGLGCPDWPGCYARANPWMARADIHAAESALPTGPVTMDKAWIEMIHRYLAMAVGVLIVTMVVASIVRRRRSPDAAGRPELAAGLLALVIVQGAFGAWTVTQRLQPIFVTTHLLLGLALLAGLTWHALALGKHAPAATDGATRVLAVVASVAVVIQVALGGWVSANYAVLACSDFPTCQGVWWPTMDFGQGFAPWRELGRTADGGFLSVAALTAIHWTHRAFAAVVLVAGGALAWRLRATPGAVAASRALAAILAAQALTGIANVVFAWPLVAAVLHDAGAAGLVVVLAVIDYRVVSSSRPRPFAESSTSAASAALSAPGSTAFPASVPAPRTAG